MPARNNVSLRLSTITTPIREALRSEAISREVTRHGRATLYIPKEVGSGYGLDFSLLGTLSTLSVAVFLHSSVPSDIA